MGLLDANISASARHGTWQGDAIGSAIFQYDALEPLLRLCSHADVEVARHVSRTLAELAYICLKASQQHGPADSRVAHTPARSSQAAAAGGPSGSSFRAPPSSSFSGNARIENVGKSQSCMVSKLPPSAGYTGRYGMSRDAALFSLPGNGSLGGFAPLSTPQKLWKFLGGDKGISGACTDNPTCAHSLCS